VTAPDTFTHAPAEPGSKFPNLGRDLVLGAAVLLASALLGVLMGLLWHAVAPRVPLYADTTAVYPKDPEGEQAIGADMTFALLGAGCGVLLAVAAYLASRAREGGVAVAVALALGGGVGGWLAMRVGVDSDSTAALLALAKSVPTGQTFDAPLVLTAKLVLLVWPMAALLTLVALTGLFTPRPTPAPVIWQTPPEDRPEPG
jgi:hypothetical protein